MSHLAAFEFPADLCCNCGVSDGSVIVQPQNTRLRGFLGVRYAADFHLPFCRQCEKTSRRRPPRLHLMSLLARVLTRGSQTSFYQPVRIKEVKPDQIVLAFTNEFYLLRFIDRNFALVHSGRVVVKRAH